MRIGRLAVTAGLPRVLRVPAHAERRDIGRDILPANDGRASYGPGTTVAGSTP